MASVKLINFLSYIKLYNWVLMFIPTINTMNTKNYTILLTQILEIKYKLLTFEEVFVIE